MKHVSSFEEQIRNDSILTQVRLTRLKASNIAK